MTLHQTLDGTDVPGPIVEFACWAEDVDEVTEDLREHCRRLVDLFAVALGMAVSRQFLASEVGEDEWKLQVDGNWRCTVSRAVEVIEAPMPTQGEIEERTLAWVTGRKLDPTLLEGGVLPWLLRAWREIDPVSKFLALFIPIEMLLAGHRPQSSVNPDRLRRIKEALVATASEDASELCGLVDAMAAKMGPSLPARFEVMARALSPATADVDAAAFRKFNRVRNALVHRGESSVTTQAKLSPTEVVHLQELTERYVVASLFRDGRDA